MIRSLAAVFAGAVFLMVARPAMAQDDVFRGVVRAPVGNGALGTVIVVACWAPEGRCLQRASQTRAIEVASRSASSSFLFRELEPGKYFVIATQDRNRNGTEDDGDWTGDVVDSAGTPVAVRTGAQVELQMRVVGQPVPAPAPSPAVASASLPTKRRAPAPPAPAKPGGLSGIYHGVTRSLVAPGPGSLVQQGITWLPTRDWFALFPDGRALVALPEEGLAPPMDWSQCGDDLTYCATYSKRGKKVVLAWPNGLERVYELQPDGESLAQGGSHWLLLPPLDGLKLDGKYLSVGNEYRTGWISFRRDGSFTEQRFLHDLGWREIGSYRELTEQETRGGKGRYTIAQNTLELRYDDGRVVRTSVYALPGDAKQARPPKIYFRSWDFHLER